MPYILKFIRKTMNNISRIFIMNQSFVLCKIKNCIGIQFIFFNLFLRYLYTKNVLMVSIIIF